MNEKLTPLSKGGRRKFTPYKPYWCNELSRLWKIAHDKENVYVATNTSNVQDTIAFHGDMFVITNGTAQEAQMKCCVIESPVPGSSSVWIL